MYRVTVLRNGVAIDDVEEFEDEASVIKALRSAAPDEYIEEVRKWMASGAAVPFVVDASSVYSDLWEYVP